MKYQYAAHAYGIVYFSIFLSVIGTKMHDDT
jgi:hypothetical protein